MFTSPQSPEAGHAGDTAEEQKKKKKEEKKKEKAAKKAAAERTAAAPPPAPPLTSEEALQQAQAEGLTLRVAKSKTGYVGVYLKHLGLYHLPKRYEAQVRRGGKMASIGYFATAEEAALCVARSPEGQAAAKGVVAQKATALTSEQAKQQAQVEGLTLRVADNKTGYSGVYVDTRPGRAKPYMAQVRRGGTLKSGDVSLGSFATAEEAALCVARSPEGREAAIVATAATVAAAAKQAAASQEE